MFLSLLHIDTGGDPDRPRPGREWLRNLYRVHQRLCMAFPSDARKTGDPDFLAPFSTSDFGDKQVHVPRGEENGFLFRIEPSRSGQTNILVQSAVEPDWDYAFHNAGHFLASPTEVKQASMCFDDGQDLRFRLVTNPTRKIDTKTGSDGAKRNGRRVPVPVDQLFPWLSKRAELLGFSVDEGSTAMQPGYAYFKKSPREKEEEARLRSVCYDGVLNVIDSNMFKGTIASGIGPGKSLGFGLLSVAPVEST